MSTDPFTRLIARVVPEHRVPCSYSIADQLSMLEWNRCCDEVLHRLESLRAEAVVVYRMQRANGLDDITPHITNYDSYKTVQHDHDTHRAILLCVEPIEKEPEPVSVEEIIEILRRQSEHFCEKLADRISRHGLKGEGKDR